MLYQLSYSSEAVARYSAVETNTNRAKDLIIRRVGRMSRLFLAGYGKVTAGRALPRSGEAVRSPLGRPQPVGLRSDPRRAFPLGPEHK